MKLPDKMSPEDMRIFGMEMQLLGYYVDFHSSLPFVPDRLDQYGLVWVWESFEAANKWDGSGGNDGHPIARYSRPSGCDMWRRDVPG